MTMIAGVELGGTKCVCVLASDGTIVEQSRVPTTDPDTTMAGIEAALDGWRRFAAIGIASFGPVGIDPDAANYGHITATTKPGWAKRFREMMAAKKALLPSDSPMSNFARYAGVTSSAAAQASTALIANV